MNPADSICSFNPSVSIAISFTRRNTGTSEFEASAISTARENGNVSINFLLSHSGKEYACISHFVGFCNGSAKTFCLNLYSPTILRDIESSTSLSTISSEIFLKTAFAKPRLLRACTRFNASLITFAGILSRLNKNSASAANITAFRCFSIFSSLIFEYIFKICSNVPRHVTARFTRYFVLVFTISDKFFDASARISSSFFPLCSNLYKTNAASSKLINPQYLNEISAIYH